MSGNNSFRKLTTALSPERRKRIDARKKELREEMALYELRKALGISQKDLAEQLGVLQPAIAKIEQRKDIKVSSLRELIEAMGGQLELTARFPEGDVLISSYHDNREPQEP